MNTKNDVGWECCMNASKLEDLHVLYSTYPAAFQTFGGAEIQLFKTKEHIERIGGCKIKLFDMFNDRLNQYDILHVFYMQPDSLLLSQTAKRLGVKFVLSPVYWRDRAKIIDVIGPSALTRIYYNVKSFRFPTFRQLFPYKDFLELADIILPNSKMEADMLSRDFKIGGGKFCVVPNGVEERFASADPGLFIEKHGVTNFVLYVARIMKRKNPLGVIKVCKDLGIPLVLVGAPNIGEEDYFYECQKTAQFADNIKMIGFLPHDSEELSSAYAAAKVFVLPSNFETPSLSALEAGLAGCNIVITSQGSTREYFREHAFYVDPFSPKDLKLKIRSAFEQPKSSELKKLILENYTWDKVARKTLEAYHLISS
jgi:glycosyltransferase involved in cell wall biosynthesis